MKREKEERRSRRYGIGGIFATFSKSYFSISIFYHLLDHLIPIPTSSSAFLHHSIPSFPFSTTPNSLTLHHPIFYPLYYGSPTASPSLLSTTSSCNLITQLTEAACVSSDCYPTLSLTSILSRLPHIYFTRASAPTHHFLFPGWDIQFPTHRMMNVLYFPGSSKESDMS